VLAATDDRCNRRAQPEGCSTGVCARRSYQFDLDAKRGVISPKLARAEKFALFFV
jgi:hypothetical protein